MIITKNDIKNLRQAMNLSQFSFGELLGVAAWTVSTWESGLFSPGKQNQAKIENLIRERGLKPEVYRDEPHFPKPKKRERIVIDISPYLKRKNKGSKT